MFNSSLFFGDMPPDRSRSLVKNCSFCSIKDLREKRQGVMAPSPMRSRSELEAGAAHAVARALFSKVPSFENINTYFKLLKSYLIVSCWRFSAINMCAWCLRCRSQAARHATLSMPGLSIRYARARVLHVCACE